MAAPVTLPQAAPLRLSLLAVLCLALFLAACSAPAAAVKDAAPAAMGMVADLQDEMRDLPGNRVAWATYWRLCWVGHPEASFYEIQSMTGEGSSRNLRRQSESCLRVEVARGENERELEMHNRRMLLAMAGGQLAFRVRAVLSDGRVGAWSAPMAVGEAGSAISRASE
jgi:hypothetical protein